jgi:ribosome-associated heat shock protein Hsp15
MSDSKHIRIDKFLWSVRIFKTRSIAANACSKGRVSINDIPAKPSRIVSTDEIITVKKPPVSYTYRIIETIGDRVSAKLVEKYLADLTPEEEKVKLYFRQSGAIGYRDKGTGRPTKKDRRIIDSWREGYIDH